jgi:phage gpG-like protein
VKKVNWPGATIPARPFLLVQDEDWAEIRAALAKHIMGGK